LQAFVMRTRASRSRHCRCRTLQLEIEDYFVYGRNVVSAACTLLPSLASAPVRCSATKFCSLQAGRSDCQFAWSEQMDILDVYWMRCVFLIRYRPVCSAYLVKIASCGILPAMTLHYRKSNIALGTMVSRDSLEQLAK
jgi:hypothetical protein